MVLFACVSNGSGHKKGDNVLLVFTGFSLFESWWVIKSSVCGRAHPSVAASVLLFSAHHRPRTVFTSSAFRSRLKNNNGFQAEVVNKRI